MTFDLKPNPRILEALTFTSLKPIDALCELVDNSIDSFGKPTDTTPQGINQINIDLPTRNELSNETGVIRISDNGPGMTPEEAENALTPGHSSQNPYDRLGLFGMGLNIATGKFARKTTLITATKDADNALIVEVDIMRLAQQGTYEVSPEFAPKGEYFGETGHGTIIELTEWWHEGNSNRDNPKRLIQYGLKNIRERLERRYATLLRTDSKQRFQIKLKDEKCGQFEHCVWDKKRFVKKGDQKIPAQQIFNELLNTQYRCTICNRIVDGECSEDSSHPTQSLEERVRGWIGVQRYDDLNHFGIDLIRNGRAIRELEKDAFFNFTDDGGKVIKDYPIDGGSGYGRIVGEVHLDHVQVDFTKQDFVRATPEWQRAMDFLRGESSLQPRQPGAEQNRSPLIKIFEGYRRVRVFGLKHMYMGVWPPSGKPDRVSRDLEKDFLRRFTEREPGYYDDEKWWEKVEEASQPPATHEICPKCDYQNPLDAEICEGCEHLLKSKDCVHCKNLIQQSASICEKCGESQIVEGPWKCNVCGHQKNPPDNESCQRCGKPKGAVNVFDFDILHGRSQKVDELSVTDLEVNLPDNNKSQKIDVESRTVSLRDGDLHLPTIAHPDLGNRKLTIFVDATHPLFRTMQLRSEHAVALEVANIIRVESMSLITASAQKHGYGLISIQDKILQEYWGVALSEDHEKVRQDMLELLEEIQGKLAKITQNITEEIFTGMSDTEMSDMLSNMRQSGEDIANMEKLKENGTFLLHIPPETVVSIFSGYPEIFFDKNIWNAAWNIPDVPNQEAVKNVQKDLKATYLNCLEDGIGFLRYTNPPLITARRARLSIEFLRMDIVD